MKFSGKSENTFKNFKYGLSVMPIIALAELFLVVGLFTPYDFWALAGMLLIIAGAIVTLALQRVPLARYVMAMLSLALIVSLLLFTQ